MAEEPGVVEHGQNLLDVAVHRCGAFAAVIGLALLNNISITDDLLPGSSLLLPEPVEPEVVKYFADGKIIPATAEDVSGTPEHLEGIDYWTISLDFKVS